MLEKRILLVDDESIILETYSSLLSEKGFFVVTARSGREALETFSRHSFDLVITDLAMPDGDGFKLLEEIKERSPHTPVIVFTGKIYRTVKEFVALLGANELLEKSCSTELFISRINESLQPSL
jgi:two-component system alkaline phosphatase synthesis response regulator PhoP